MPILPMVKNDPTFCSKFKEIKRLLLPSNACKKVEVYVPLMIYKVEFQVSLWART